MLDARLRRVRTGVPVTTETGATATPQRGWLRLATVAVAGVMVLTFVAVVYRLSRPPTAIRTKRLADGTEVRLLAITRGEDRSYAYDPTRSRLRAWARRAGWHLGDDAIQAQAPVPPGSITLWLRLNRPQAQLGYSATCGDDQQRVYRAAALGRSLRSGEEPWGRATLCWVSLANYDHRATRLYFAVPAGRKGEVVTFGIDGPAEPAANWVVGRHYPLAAGDDTADVRLWQLRAVDPVRLAPLISQQKLPPGADNLVLADLDIREHGARQQPGLWEVTVDDAVTAAGERLEAVQQRAGLAWLTNGRDPATLGAVSLTVAARKWVRDQGLVVFRSLQLPAADGETKAWHRQSDEPFPEGKFVAEEGLRVRANLLRLTLSGVAPPRTEALALAFAEGLDNAGGRPLPDGEATATFLEKRDSPQQASWKWTFDLAVAPGAKVVALAFRLHYRRVTAATTATLIGEVQRRETAPAPAALGLLLTPIVQGPNTPPRLQVSGLVKDSRAAKSPLRPGDEVVRIDNLPATMLSRVLLRHEPTATVSVTYRRAGQLATAPVGLDPAPDS